MMPDEELDTLLRDARRSYHAPPEPPLDAMWSQIERTHFGSPLSLAGARPVRMLSFRLASMAAAAALVMGVGMGWLAASGTGNREPRAVAVTADTVPASRFPVSGSQPVVATTSKYLGETAALLIALDDEGRDGRPDRQFVAQAGELLSTTRLLLDSQAASNPELRNLLEDLELVLAQIARLPARRDRGEIDLITKALEQRDVVPRLRSVVAGIANSDN
jgi:hypothetical protein